jgi:hypothetical protein
MTRRAQDPLEYVIHRFVEHIIRGIRKDPELREEIRQIVLQLHQLAVTSTEQKVRE